MWASLNQYGMATGGKFLSLNLTHQNTWGSGNISYSTNSANNSGFMGSGCGSNGLVGAFGNIGEPSVTFFTCNNISYASGENSFGTIGGSFGRNNAGPTPSFSATNDWHIGNVFGIGSFYEDLTMWSSSPDLEGSGLFGYGLVNEASDYMPRTRVVMFVIGLQIK